MKLKDIVAGDHYRINEHYLRPHYLNANVWVVSVDPLLPYIQVQTDDGDLLCVLAMELSPINQEDSSCQAMP